MLYHGDCLHVMRGFDAGSVDLAYLDPPFNTGSRRCGTGGAYFDDAWRWCGQSEGEYADLTQPGGGNIATLLAAMRAFLGTGDMMAYLVMLASRLRELHRVLKPTGTLYLHCDPTASHYAKLALDAVFGARNFGNEIIWQRTGAKGLASKRLPRNHDVIFRYTKSSRYVWIQQYGKYDPEYVSNFYKYEDEDGRRYALTDLTNPNKNRPNLTYEFLGVKRVWRWTKRLACRRRMRMA